MLEDYLSDAKRYKGGDSEVAAIANDHLGSFHFQILNTKSFSNDASKKHLQLSVAHYKESLRIHTKLSGSNHPMCQDIASNLSPVVMALKRLNNLHP